jgi:hypothetical protein
MSGKRQAGFRVTLADLWGLFIRFHTLGQTTVSNFYDFSLPHGADESFSGIRNLYASDTYTGQNLLSEVRS